MLSSCKLGDLNAVKEILQSGNYDIYEKHGFGKNGFMYACIFGHLNIVKYLVEMKYNIHEKDKYGGNAFMHACDGGHLNIVKYLVEINYNIYEKCNGGMNGFMVACVHGYLNIVKYLVEINYDIHEKTNDGINGFMVACSSGHLNIVKYLVEINYNIHEKTNDGRNSLRFALSGTFERDDIVISLLEHGCEINEEYIKNIERNERLCKKIENRMEQIQTFYDAIEKNLNEIYITSRVVHEIKTFTYGLQNFKNVYMKLHTVFEKTSRPTGGKKRKRENQL